MPPPRSLSGSASGPESADDTFVTRREFPAHKRPISSRHVSTVPETAVGCLRQPLVLIVNLLGHGVGCEDFAAGDYKGKKPAEFVPPAPTDGADEDINLNAGQVVGEQVPLRL